MASLVPGLLSKLLNNAGNNEVRVTGEHRSALLQVIEIVPSLCGAPDDPWHSRGFFLKVSDSVHSAYASISDEDLDLIYSDKIQLGRFVYVSRFDVSSSGSSVPVLRGLKPAPYKRRPCVGNPKDLVSSELLPNSSQENKGASKANVKKVDGDSTKTRRRDSLGDGKVQSGASEMRRLSLDSARKIWDHQIPASKTKPHQSSKNVCSDKKALPKIDSSLRRPSLSNSPLKSKNELTSSSKETVKPLRKELKAATDYSVPSCLVKVPLRSIIWSKQRISWDAIPPAIQNLGKETVCCRNSAFLAAARALEEASAADSVIRCLQTFAKLCDSARTVHSGPLVEQYLDLYESMQKAAVMVNSLLSASLPDAKSTSFNRLQPDACRLTSTKTNAASWIYAAMGTNLSKFNLFKKPETNKVANGDKCHYIILCDTLEEFKSENQSPQNKTSPRNHSNSLYSNAKQVQSPSERNISSMKKMNSEREDCYRGSGLKEAASLAENLLLVSREWFLNYMEESLNVGFEICRGKNSEIACLLRQLKRVNNWLDELVGSRIKDNARIEDLIKKLYGFLLEHVDSAVVCDG